MKISINLSIVFLIMLLANQVSADPVPLKLVTDGKSAYKIVLPAKATAIEIEAANVLHRYVQKVSSAELPIITDNQPKGRYEVLIGNTSRMPLARFAHPDALSIQVSGESVMLNGGKSNGVLYAVYTFVERFLGCRKYAADTEFIPELKSIVLPATLLLSEKLDCK